MAAEHTLEGDQSIGDQGLLFGLARDSILSRGSFALVHCNMRGLVELYWSGALVIEREAFLGQAKVGLVNYEA